MLKEMMGIRRFCRLASNINSDNQYKINFFENFACTIKELNIRNKI